MGLSTRETVATLETEAERDHSHTRARSAWSPTPPGVGALVDTAGPERGSDATTTGEPPDPVIGIEGPWCARSSTRRPLAAVDAIAGEGVEEVWRAGVFGDAARGDNVWNEEVGRCPVSY